MPILNTVWKIPNDEHDNLIDLVCGTISNDLQMVPQPHIRMQASTIIGNRRLPLRSLGCWARGRALIGHIATVTVHQNPKDTRPFHSLLAQH